MCRHEKEHTCCNVAKWQTIMCWVFGFTWLIIYNGFPQICYLNKKHTLTHNMKGLKENRKSNPVQIKRKALKEMNREA